MAKKPETAERRPHESYLSDAPPEYVRRPDSPTPRAAPMPAEVMDTTIMIKSAAANDTWFKRSVSPTRKSSSGGGHRPSRLPDAFDPALAEEWLAWVADSVRWTVANVRCTKCGSAPGLPCRNGAYHFDLRPDGTHPNRNMRPFYQAWVHQERAIVANYLLTERILVEVTE